jgi:integrase
MVDARRNGERLRRVVETHEEAVATLRDWGVDMPARAPATAPQESDRDRGPTLRHVSEEWILWLEANARPATVETAHECLRAIEDALPGLLDRPAMSLEPTDVRRLKAALGKRAVATQAKILVRFKGMLAWAARPPEGDGRREGGGLLSRVPVYVRPPRVPKPSPASVAPRLVNDSLTTTLLRSARDPRIRCAIALARYCGLRRSEILRLKLGDVDLDGGMIRVLGPTKGHKPRLAPLGPRGREEVHLYLASRKLKPAAGERSPEMPMFPGWTASAIAQAMRRLGRRVGWKTAKPGLHSLRATWCTELLAKGPPLPAVQEAGGWTSLAAMQHYAGAGPEVIGRLARLC